MTHTLNTDRTAAVATDVYWMPITRETPRNVKVLCICKKAGIASVSSIFVDEEFWTHWAPLPKWGDE
jgi:hypothetical protein